MTADPSLFQPELADGVSTSLPQQREASLLQLASAPLVWLLIGPNAGETSQQRVLGKALGWRVVEKPVEADLLLPEPGEPWPDLVISFGKGLRAARRVIGHSDRRTRLVHLGRPRWVPLAAIDLIIPMPQDRMPPGANVLPIRMSFNVNDPAEGDAAAARLEARWQSLPRPWSALLVGGTTRHFSFDAASAGRLGRLASEHIQRSGGSLLITTSPRTTPEALKALRAALSGPQAFYEFRPDDADNPLAAWLHLADDFIVTGDTASMLAEARRTLRPVHVMPLAPSRSPLRRLLSVLQGWTPKWAYDALLKRGIIAAPVDLGGWLADRIAEGDFAVLGESARPFRPRILIDDDLARVVERIRELI